MKRARGVCSAENGSIVAEDWTILFGNKTNSKDLPKCRNKRSKSILWRCNFTETAEWKRKGIASGGIMPKQQKGEYKYFVSFGVPEYPHQCSLASQTAGKASSTSPPKCSPCPTVDFVLYDNWGSSGAAPYVESSIPGHWWWLWSGGREGTEVWPVPVLCLTRSSASLAELPEAGSQQELQQLPPSAGTERVIPFLQSKRVTEALSNP